MVRAMRDTFARASNKYDTKYENKCNNNASPSADKSRLYVITTTMLQKVIK